jgi:hypothetical protein
MRRSGTIACCPRWRNANALGRASVPCEGFTTLALMLLCAPSKLVTSFPHGGADQMTRLERARATGHGGRDNSFWHRATKGKQTGYIATNCTDTHYVVRRSLLTMMVRVALKPYASAHQRVPHLHCSTKACYAMCQCVALHYLLRVHRQHSRLFTGARHGLCLQS